MMYGLWQCVCGALFSSAHPFKQWWHQWWYGHGDDNYYSVPKGMTAAEYRAQVQRELAEQKERDDAAQQEVDGILTTARKLREKYRDIPIGFKMSRETWRRLNVIGNFKSSTEPVDRLYGLSVVFDEEIPTGEVKEVFK